MPDPEAIPPHHAAPEVPRGVAIARQRIAFAQHQRAGDLNLSHLHLTELPPELFQLTTLTDLNLSGNNLTTLPPQIGHLTALVELNLRNNQLKVLPPEFGSLTALRWLNLSDNHFLATVPDTLWSLPRLRRLDLRGNFSLHPPASFLRRSWDKLQTHRPIPDPEPTIPDDNFTGTYEMAEVLHLIEQAHREKATRLNLSYLHLPELPPQIGKLTTLQILDLHDNYLRTLPPELANLTDLRELNLSSNLGLAPVPPVVFQLTSLQRLRLGDILRLETIPPELAHLTNLQELRLYANHLPEFPTPILHLTNLTLLDLRSTRLQTLPPKISQLRNLQVLLLAGTCFPTLPETLRDLPHLRRLQLIENFFLHPRIPKQILDSGTPQEILDHYFLNQLSSPSEEP